MNSKLNPTLACHNPGCLSKTAGPQAEYCSLKCRDSAKRKRRRDRERGLVLEEISTTRMNCFGPISEESLMLVTEALINGTMESPVWFTDAHSFKAVELPGFVWEVLADGTGKLSLR